MHIVGAHTREEIGLIAMHIAERLEAVLLAGAEQPIYRALLIGFQMIRIEVAQEIAADHLAGCALSAESVGNKAQVLLERVLAVYLADEINEFADNVVAEILVIADGNDVISVGDNGLVLAGIPFAARIGEPVHIERIPPEHTAHGVRDEGDYFIAHGADIVRALHALRHIVLAVKHAMHGHILVRHIRRQFVLQTVNVNENAVEFFFVLFELLEALFALGLPSSIFLGNQSSHINYPSNSSVCLAD